MATVLNRITKQIIRSVNTPDFDPVDWIINPDLSAVVGQPTRYFIITGDVVTLATVAQQTVIDDAIAAAQVVSDKNSEKQEFDDRRVLIALALLLVDEFNVLRAQHGLAPRTFAQLRTVIRDQIDAG